MWFKIFLFALAFCIHNVKVNASVESSTEQVEVSIKHGNGNTKFVGGVYVMSNNFTSNSVLAYGRKRNGKLAFLGEYFTGGIGTFLDAGEGVNPLLTAYSLLISGDNRYVFAVNAGSDSFAVLRILPNFKLELTDVKTVPSLITLSIAEYRGLVYVACADADGISETNIARKGALYGFRLIDGRLIPIDNSFQQLLNRPSAIKFTTSGRSLVVSSVYAGIDAVNETDVNEIVSYKVRRISGRLRKSIVDTVTSTTKDEVRAGKRLLPAAIGFQIVSVGRFEYVVAGESRISGLDGAFTPQTPSISTWRISKKGKMSPIQLDYVIGDTIVPGLIGAPWQQFSKDKKYFWAATTGSNTVSAFSFKNGVVDLLEYEAGISNFPVDMWTSRDGKYLYQLGLGELIVFKVLENGWGLQPIQNVSNTIPATQAQGIVAF